MSYTVVPELWFIFNKVVKLSPMTEQGFTISMLDTYLANSEHSGMWTKREFWNAMDIFLSRLNEHLAVKREHRRLADKAKNGR